MIFPTGEAIFRTYEAWARIQAVHIVDDFSVSGRTRCPAASMRGPVFSSLSKISGLRKGRTPRGYSSIDVAGWTPRDVSRGQN